MLKSAVIGVGRWGSKHVEEWKNVKDCVLEKVCDKNSSLRQEYRPEFFVQNYRELLDSDINCFSVCTPNKTHYRIAKDLLNAGKHVLLEKPMCLDSEQCLELHELAEKKEIVLIPGHIYRFNNSLQRVKQLLEKIGVVKEISLSWTDVSPPSTKQSIIHDLGPHMWDILSIIFNSELKVSSVKNSRGEAEITGSLRGAEAFVELNWNGASKKRELHVKGSKGEVLLDVAKQKFYDPAINHTPNNTLRDELQYFVNRVKGETSCVVNGLHGYESIKWVEKCLR